MTVCNFFLQGRCRYGDKCWNEHPTGGRGGGGGGYNNNNYNRSSGQQQPRGGGGGFGNRVWVNPSQQKGGYIQPSSFSSHGEDDWGRGGRGGGNDWGRGGGGGGGGGNDWGRGGGGGGGNDWGRGGGGGGGGNDWGRGGGGGRRDGAKSSEFSFSSQNRFTALNSSSGFEKGARGSGGGAAGDEDDDKKLELIQVDMEAWESSGQWGFSCYSNFKTAISGFTDLSPEELRLEYYSTRASGDPQSYVNGINQLLSRWRSRVQELRIMNAATRAALLAELNNPAPQASSSGFGSTTATGFGSSASGFESKGFGAPAQPSGFSFAAPAGGFGSSAAPSSSAGFGSTFSAPSQPPSGFGSSSSAVTGASPASSFSFASTSTDKPPAPSSAFGSASGFSFSSAANTGGFGSNFGTEAPAGAGSSGGLFGQTSGGFGAAAAAGVGSAGGTLESLFSPADKLTPEELSQFKAKKFTLGQIPLKPPPADMLVV